MSKMRKRIAAGVLAAVMSLSLAACSNSGTTSTPTPANSGNNNTSSGSGTASSTPAASSAADSAADDAANSDAAAPEVEKTGREEAEDLADIIPDQTVTLDVFSMLANYSGKQLGWFADEMKEKFNVELNIINNAAGTFSTRLESGNLGDIVIFGGYNDYITAANAGQLLDWEDEDMVQDYGPFIWENMQPALNKNKNLEGSDGKLHGYGYDVALNLENTKANDYWPCLRFDLYQELGCPEIKTLDDYIPVFEKMKEICPTSDSGKETYAVSLFSDWDGDMVMFVKTMAAFYGYDEFGFGLYNVNDNTYEDCLQPDGWYLKCLKWYNTLYQKGLLNPNSMTQKFDDVSSQMIDGSTFFNQFKWMGADLYNNADHLAQGKAMYCVPPADAKNLVYGLSPYGNERIWTIGANTQYPELCMAIINWLSTPDGFLTTQYGPKGVTWDYNEDGKTYMTELGLAAQKDKKTTMVGSASYEDGEFKMNNTTLSLDCINPKSGEPFNKDKWTTAARDDSTEILNKWREWSGYDTADEFLLATDRQSVSIQSMYSTTPRGSDLDVIWSQIQTCIKDGSWQAIFAKTDEEFDQIVADMTQKAKDYGYDQCVEYQQKEAENRKKCVEEALADFANY